MRSGCKRASASVIEEGDNPITRMAAMWFCNYIYTYIPGGGCAIVQRCAEGFLKCCNYI